MRPTPEMLAGSGDSDAQAVLAAEPGAVAAYDHVPMRAAAAVFSMDTASEVFMLHTAKVRKSCGSPCCRRLLLPVLPV